MTKEKVIEMYEDLMYKHGEFDIWDDDIKPRLKKMTTKEILRQYQDDKKYYEARKRAGGYWG